MAFFRSQEYKSLKQSSEYGSYYERNKITEPCEKLLYDYVYNKCINDYPKYIGKINLSKNHEAHVKPGDKAIVNIYDFIKSSSNGWDTGKNYFMYDLPSSNFYTVKPIVGEILEVYPTFEKADDRITRFKESILDNYDLPYLERLLRNPNVLIEAFEQYLDYKDDHPIFNRYQVYLNCKVKYVLEEKVKIVSINAFSFINLNSKEGEFTLNSWYRMHKLEKGKNKIHELLKEQEENIKEEVQNLKIII